LRDKPRNLESDPIQSGMTGDVSMLADSCKILLVYPQFQPPSYWNLKATCHSVGARHLAPPLGLLTVAALLPRTWDLRLIDCNVEPLTDADIDAADLVMTGGMYMQQRDTLDIIDRCHRLGKLVAVGGPAVTSSPHIYGRADFQVRGEAETVIQQFIEAWTSGARSGVFEAEKFTADVTQTPIPRFDLLRYRDYLFINVQFSRGCPFTCEFCDIIELYGRRPRTKTNAQMLAELDALYQSGYRGHVDFVDDNLIGNKKAVKQFLPALIAWQKAHRFPFEFTTEASVNLSDDDELLGMMRDANFFGIFVGIESPDPETLVLMQKKQNTRRDLVSSIHKINDAGLFVIAGFILGFDSEKGSVAKPMIDYIEASGIPACIISLLYALPNTQLARRLRKEGRLYVDYENAVEKDMIDTLAAGPNFVTARPRRDILVDYVRVLRAIYTPAAFFARTRGLGRRLGRPLHGLLSRDSLKRDLARLGHFFWYLSRQQPAMILPFIRLIAHLAWHNPKAIKHTLVAAGMYLHLGPFSQSLIRQIEDQIAEIDRDEWKAPAVAPAVASPARPAVAATAAA